MRQPPWRTLIRLHCPFRQTLPVTAATPRRTLLTEAYSRGPSTPPLLNQTIGEHFASIVSKFGDRTAIVSRHQQTRLSYDALDRKSNALARSLRDIGVKRGDRVATSLGNNIEYAIVPVNPAFNATQVIAALNHLEASHLIIGAETNLPRKSPRSNISLLQQIVPDLQGHQVESEAVPSLHQIIIVENSNSRINTANLRPIHDYNHIIEDGSSKGNLDLDQPLSPHDVVNIQFTSGTTSMPKAACLTHHSILNNGNSIGDRMLLTEHDIICCPPPLFHCFGCILGYMATATHGSTIVFPTEAFDPLATIKAVQEEKCTALYGVPTMFLAEFELLANGTVQHTGFEHLRTGIAAGSSIPAELMRKLHKVLNLTELTICYGMTETSPVSAMTTTDDPIEKRIDSVGRLLPHVEAKIVDPVNKEKILLTGQRGELAVSGYLVMKQYWGDKEKTKEVMLPDKAGKIWMHTGDEALMDSDGYLKITGRIKDIIIKGGENIHPLEIENCLLAHPKVAEVSVVGLPDERYGEAVAAFVVGAAMKGTVVSLTEEEIRDMLSLVISTLSLLLTLLSISLTSALPGTNPRSDDPRIPSFPNKPTSSSNTKLPTSSSNTKLPTFPHVLGTPIPLLPDPCGPPLQSSNALSASASTCYTSVSSTLDPQNPFHLECQKDKTGYTINWESCIASLNSACTTLSLSRFEEGIGSDRWVWATAPTGAFDCTLGFWVPSNSSLLPTYDRCKNDIFGQMISGCEGNRDANLASVNLKRLPRRTETERDTGEAVDPGYPSELSRRVH
ncbi:MAG: hypothetical protein Q9166_002271 [cf. Caloplaca sp. 2 TL-2023]